MAEKHEKSLKNEEQQFYAKCCKEEGEGSGCEGDGDGWCERGSEGVCERVREGV